MATCYSRTWKSGKVSWYTKVKDARGVWKPVLLKGVKTDKQAQKLADEIERERERAGHGLPAASPFLGTFAELCAWAYEEHFSKQASQQPDGSRLRQHAGDPEKGTSTWLGALPVRQVTGPKLAEYLSEVEKTPTVRGKPPAPSSINRLRAIFVTVFDLATEHGKWAGPNPAKLTRERSVVKGSHDILQPFEIGPTLDACRPYWRGCLAVGLYAGLRKGEIFALEKRDVNLKDRLLYVRRSHERQTTKGGTHSAVPIHEDLVPFLEEALQSPGPLLFPDAKGKRRSRLVNLPKMIRAALARAGFIERWKLACRRSGCGYRAEVPHGPEEPLQRDCPTCGFRLWPTPHARKIRWHEATRHTCASHTLMGGASLASVQKILRHSSPQITADTYGHLSAGFLGSEINRMRVPAGHTVQTVSKTGETLEPTAARAHAALPECGAPVVRDVPNPDRREGSDVMIQHQNSLEREWSRGVSNPGPMHCERIGGVSTVAPAFARLSQAVGITGTPEVADSTALPPVPPCPGGRGAPMVRKRGLAHQAGKTAYIPGSGRTPEELLTVKQVSERLSVGRMWVRRRIESGELPTVKAHPTAPALIPRLALEDYLRRFPGIVPTAQPEPAGPASRKPTDSERRARKGAA